MFIICSKIPGRVGDQGDNMIGRPGTEDYEGMKAARAVAFVEVTHPRMYLKQCQQ